MRLMCPSPSECGKAEERFMLKGEIIDLIVATLISTGSLSPALFYFTYRAKMFFSFSNVNITFFFANKGLVQKKNKKKPLLVQHCWLEQIIGAHNLIHG